MKILNINSARGNTYNIQPQKKDSLSVTKSANIQSVDSVSFGSVKLSNEQIAEFKAVLEKSNEKLRFAKLPVLDKLFNMANFVMLNPDRVKGVGDKYFKCIDNIFNKLIAPTEKDITLYAKTSLAPKMGMQVGDIISYKGCSFKVGHEQFPKYFTCNCYNPKIKIPQGSKILLLESGSRDIVGLLPKNPKFKVLDIEHGTESNIQVMKDIVLELVR